MKAQTVIDVILGEAVHGSDAQRYEDMLGIASVIHNRAVTGGVAPQDVVSVQSQFNAYDKKLPAGVDKYRSLAEKAWNEVRTKGPVHNGTFYATEKASKNLPNGLKEVTRTEGHVYYTDPKERTFKTADGYVKPDMSRIGSVAPSPAEFIANNPQPGGFGLAGLAYDDPNMSVPVPTPRPRGSGGLGMAALVPSGSLEFYNSGQDTISPGLRSALEGTSAEFGHPLGINSGYRAPDYNRGVGGARGSYHMRGEAADINMAHPDGTPFTDAERQQLVSQLTQRGAGGFITYTNSPNMLHVDMRPRPGDAPHFMHDKTSRNMGSAPAWFQEMRDTGGLYFPKEMAAPQSRDQALATAPAAGQTDAYRQLADTMGQAGVRGLGAMPEPAAAPAVDPAMAEAYRQYGDSRVAASHMTPEMEAASPVTPFPAATPPASVEVASAGTYLPPLQAAPVSPVERGGPLAPPAGLGSVPIPTPRPETSVSLPDQAPIPTPRPSGAMGNIPIPTPRPDTAAPAMSSARTIADMPVAQDAGQFPGAGRDYFPPAPAPYFPPAPGANSGAFDASPFWETKSGGLGRFGGIMKGAATGAAVGGLPGALVGGLLGSGVLQKVFNNTPGGGNPSAPAAAAHGGYVGSGVNAMASVFSGKAAPGSLAASRSNPGTYAMSLPGGLVARSYESPTHGYITGIYGLGPNEETNPGAKFGKVAALSPDAKSWSFVGPEEARGLQAKGWSISIGPSSKASIAAPAAPAAAKAVVSPAPATTTAAVAKSQAKEAAPAAGLGKAISDIGKAVAQAFGLGQPGIGGLGTQAMANPAMANPYGLTGGGMGLGGMSGMGIGNYSGAGMGGGWSEANGPAGNRA